MFAAVVREGELVRLPSKRIVVVLAGADEPNFFDCEYLDNGQPVRVHCHHMTHVAAPRDIVAGPAVAVRSTLDQDAIQDAAREDAAHGV